MGYKDRTFCQSDCTDTKCFRFISDEVRAGARKWADSFGMKEALLAVSDFSRSCPYYTPPKEATPSA